MDINQWKLILFDWIKASELIDVFGTLEHVQLDDYFERFYRKIHSEVIDSHEKTKITNFLKDTYPDFEILYDETSNISSQDFVYVFSLLLHYSCIREKNEYFQIASTKLNSKYQLCVACFLEHFINQKTFTKEKIRTGIKQATVLLSPIQTKYFALTSPLRTPKKSDISPPTPSKEYINSKLKELKSLKSQLDNERYEKNLLELELKQNHEKLNELVKKCKDLNHEVQTLKSSVDVNNDTENLSPNKAQREYQIRRKMQKEIQHREDLITDLKYEVEDANAINKKYQEKINVMEKQMKEMRLKMRELDASVDDLVYNMNTKDQKIFELEEEKKELLEFINETRSSANGKDISSDCLDFSCSSTLYTTSCSDFSENLAKSVIDVQLKEKEMEITKLNEIIVSSNKEKKELEKKIAESTKSIEILENTLSETRASTTKLFEEKSTEIQLLQNQLNTTTIKNKELQREIEIKQKINLKMLEENDSHKIETENLQKQIKELNEQKVKREDDLNKIQNELKIVAEKQLKEDVKVKLKDISNNALLLDENIQKHFANISSKLKGKEEKILQLTNLVVELKNKYESLIKESYEKLDLKANENSLLNMKILELEETHIREKIFSDKLERDKAILSAKLMQCRTEMIDLQNQFKQKVETMDEDKRNFQLKMEAKLEGYKDKIKVKYNEIMSENKFYREKLSLLETQNKTLMKKHIEEKDEIVKNFDLNVDKIEKENAVLKEENEANVKIIKNLTQELEQEKRENCGLISRLRFMEKIDNYDYEKKGPSSSTPHSKNENFDNAYLNDLKNGAGFESITGSSSLFQKRNSKYPPHMRDTYALGAIDRVLSEEEMKSGIFSSTEIEPKTPTKENRLRTKQPVYNRPGQQTPSKNGRLSLSSNTNILKDTTNTEKLIEDTTPRRGLNLLKNFMKPKNEKSPKQKRLQMTSI